MAIFDGMFLSYLIFQGVFMPTQTTDEPLAKAKLSASEKKAAQLAALIKQRKQIDARIQLKAAAQKNTERKEDTRRKILLGACVLEKGEELGVLDIIKSALDGYLTRALDRALFKLPELPE
jgi:hypothetical protein